MSEKKFRHLHGGQGGAALAVRVIPRATKNEIVEIMQDGAIKIRLNSPPDDANLNSALVRFLSSVLGISTSKIEVVAGETSRSKLISVLDLDSETTHARIMRRVQ